jgi:hypothetical protein
MSFVFYDVYVMQYHAVERGGEAAPQPHHPLPFRCISFPAYPIAL